MPKRGQIKTVTRKFDWGEMEVIELGEKGRGRKLSLIPYQTKSELIEEGRTRKGNLKIIDSKVKDGWITVISGCGPYTRNTYGSAYIQPKDKEKVEVLAYGIGAFGDAGRIGCWFDFLLKVQDGVLVKVKPTGEDKVESYWLYFGGGDELSEEKVYTIKKEEMPLFCELMEIDLPPEKYTELLDLADLVDFVE